MNNLKYLRTQCGLALRKVQEYTGIDFSRLRVIETKNPNIETKTIEKLCNFYKVSASYLLGHDGFIEYYDEENKKYFSLPFEQYKNILTDDVISISIVNCQVQRIISKEGYNRINQHDNVTRKALDIRITTMHYIEFLKTLNDHDFNSEQEILMEYFEERRMK